MNLPRRASLALLLCALAAAPHVPDLTQYPSPRVVLAQDAGGPVLWWDATMWVERLIDEATPRDEALRALEYEAVKLFVTRAPALPAGSKHLRVNVVFTKSGLVSGPYRTSAYEGVHTLLTVEGDVRPQTAFPPGWEAAARRGTFPAGISVKPAADLPRETSGDAAQ